MLVHQRRVVLLRRAQRVSRCPSVKIITALTLLAVPWDWALDFRNVIVEIGPSVKPSTRSPLHFQRGALDGQVFGYDDIIGESMRCVSISDPSTSEVVPAEYLRPARPTQPGQVVVIIAGDAKGQQRTTSYENDGQWMMEAEAGDMLVLPGESLCRIWKA
jgi:transcription elongation factor SPT5